MFLLSKKNQADEQEVVIENTSKLTDYDVYIMSQNEKMIYIAMASVALFVVGFIFYRNFILSGLLCPLALLYPKIRTKEIIAKRKNELCLQFKDMLYALSSSLSAGKSVESSLKEVLKDLSIQYPDPDTYIIKEVEYLVRRTEMNETIEVALADFAARAHLEDVENFVDVFQTCKRTGGNIVEIIKNTSNIINDKIEIKQEIGTLLAARKFEQKVLNIMPIGLILLLSVTAGDYMHPVFNTIAGRIAMTLAIILLAGSYFVSGKIMNIEV